MEVRTTTDPDNQKHIAEILSTHDALIENNGRRIALLEKAVRELYQEWVVRLRFPGHEHTRVRAGVPEGWERKMLGDLCHEVREIVFPEEVRPETPYIGLEHIPRRSISLDTWETAEKVKSAKHCFNEGDFLFGKIRPYFHKVGIAFVDGIASSDAIVVRALREARALVLMLISSDAFVAFTAQTMREGSKMPRADWKQMQQYPVLLPQHSILRTFEAIAEPIIQQLKVLNLANRRLRDARDLLLPRLMSGEIAV
jgi:type I restriction enzyme S subunit